MPYRRADSPLWWASYTDADGRRIRRSTGTTDRREAEAISARWKLEAFRAKTWGEQPRRTFEELMVGWLRATQPEKRPAGHRRDLDATRHLRAVFGGLSLQDLSAARVRGYIDARRGDGVSPSTVNRELAVLSAALNFARREWEWVVPNAVAGRKLRQPEGRLRWLTRSEAATLIEAAGLEWQAEHLPDFIRLALHTGMRKGELLNLEWARVDFGARLLHLEAKHTKTASRRTVPLNEGALGALRGRLAFRAMHCPGSPWVFSHQDGKRIGDIKHAFATACRRSGIEDFRIHDLRHTCAAWLIQAGASLAEVRDVLGHSTVRMTERYAHLAPENIRSALARLDGEPVTLAVTPVLEDVSKTTAGR